MSGASGVGRGRRRVRRRRRRGRKACSPSSPRTSSRIPTTCQSSSEECWSCPLRHRGRGRSKLTAYLPPFRRSTAGWEPVCSIKGCKADHPLTINDFLNSYGDRLYRMCNTCRADAARSRDRNKKRKSGQLDESDMAGPLIECVFGLQTGNPLL